MIRKVFLILITIFILSNKVLAYTEQPNSPENLINVLNNDFNTTWISEDELLTVHNENEYLLGLLTDYVIVKDMANDNIGTNFSIQDNNIKIYNIFEQVGRGQKTFFDLYNETFALLNSEVPDMFVAPTLNYLVNTYSKLPEDLIGNSYGYFKKAYAISNLIKSFTDPNQLALPREISNTIITFSGTTAGGIAGAYTKFLFDTIGTMEELSLKNRIYLYAALYFEAKKLNEEGIYFNDSGTLKPTSSMYTFFTNEQIQTFYNFTETDELTNSQYNEVTAYIIRTPMENMPFSEVEIFDIMYQSQNYLSFIKSYLNLLDFYGYYNWADLSNHLKSKISNELSTMVSLRNSISTDVLKVSQKDENGLVTIINTTDKELHSIYLVDKDLVLDDKSEVIEKIDPYGAIVIDASNLEELNELHYNIIGKDETLLLDTLLPEVISNINITGNDFITYNEITFNAPSNIILESNVVYDWYFGDGETQTVNPGQSVTHSYEVAKTYSVRLVIKKDGLVVDDISTSLKIEENQTIKPTNPIISQSATNYSIGDSITFNATSNSSIDSNTIEYHWYNAKSNLFIANSPSIEITTADESYEAYYVIAKNIHGESEAKYVYIYENSSNSGTVEKPTFIYDRYTRTNSNNSTETIDEYTLGSNIFGNIELISGNLTLTDNIEVSGDFLEKYGTLDLNGYSLTINGNFIQSGGSVKINNGELIVKGDYLIQTANGDGTYTYSDGKLFMLNESDRVTVEGNFVMDSSYTHGSWLRAGIMEVQGNFTQKSTHPSTTYYSERDNFAASGTHKVILSGSSKQTVSFEDPTSSYSHFNILELKNTSSEGIEFLSDISIEQNIIQNDSKTVNLSIKSMSLTENTIIYGDLNLTGETVDLNGYTLTVTGNLVQSDGYLKINNGELIVKGDYLIQTANGDGTYTYSDGKLFMLNESDRVTVEGNFVMDSSYTHGSWLRAGIMEVQGNFTQKSTHPSTTYYSERDNFAASGTHKVILSGSSKQTVSFEDPTSSYSHFNILELKNTSSEGIEFLSDISIEQNIIQNDSKTVNLSIKSMSLTENTIIYGDLNLTGETVDLNGYTLTVTGNLVQSDGYLKINNGELIVKGDYLIQTPQTDGTYTYSDGYLYMQNESDRVTVEGNFVIDSDSSQFLSAGIMEVQGNFTQKSTSENYYKLDKKNFDAEGTHKVILSGNNKQTVSFEDPSSSYSHFNILELKNTSLDGITFVTNTIVTKELIATNCSDRLTLTNLTASLTTFDTTCQPNRAPIITVDSLYTIDEDTTKLFSFDISDADGDSVTATIESNASNGNVLLVNGSFQYTPNENYNGTDSFVAKFTDSYQAVVEKTVNINVNAVNDAPTISGTPQTLISQGLLYSFKPVANDIDTDTLTFFITNQPAWTTFNTSTGELKGTPTKDNVGVYKDIQIGVKDTSDVEAKLALFDITVNSTNEIPTVTINESITTNEDTSSTQTAIIEDIDGDIVTISIKTEPLNGKVEIVNNDIKYIPNQDYFGNDTFTLEFNDNNGGVVEKTILVVVNAVNDKPILSPIVKTVDKSIDTVSFTSSEFISNYTDIENEQLQKIKIVSLPLDGNLEFNSNAILVNQEITTESIENLIYLAEDNYKGEIVFKVQVFDGIDWSDDALITINIDTTPFTETIILNQGWNLIALPLDTIVDLSSLNDPYIQTVRSLQNGEWKTWNINSNSNTLTSLEDGYGYWIKSSQNTTFEISGEKVANQINLNQNQWNMIGSQTISNINQFFIDNPNVKVVWKYSNGEYQAISTDTDIQNDLDSKSIPHIYSIEPNEGVFIK